MRGTLYRRSLDLALLVSLWCGPKARSSCVSWSCSSVYRALLALPHSMSLFSAVRSVRPTSTLESPPKGKRVPRRNATGRSGTRVITNNRQAQPLCELSSGNDGSHPLYNHTINLLASLLLLLGPTPPTPTNCSINNTIISFSTWISRNLAYYIFLADYVLISTYLHYTYLQLWSSWFRQPILPA